MRIDVAGFLGANTQVNKLLLADGVGTQSLNQAPGRGDLRPWRQPLTVAAAPADRKTIYRMGRATASDTLYWLSWTSIVHVVRGFDREDTQERTYFTGAAGGPAWTDNVMAITGGAYPASWRPLGMPAPASPPLLTIASAGVSTQQADRWVCTTFVNDIGWESAPSPPAKITAKTDATLKLSGLEAKPAGNYEINRRRIYMTQTGATGATEFFFLAEIAYTSGAQEWTQVAEVLSNDVLATQTTLGGWLPCPADAKCLTQLWNGMAAVISGKGIRPCVANIIYAYPLDYEIVIADQPVAMATWGQNLLVLTTGTKPSLITGQDPASLSEQPLDGLAFNGACLSVQSVVAVADGVCWAAPEGLGYMGSRGGKLVTAGLIHPDEWRAMKPETMVGGLFMGLYLAFYNDGAGWKGFAIDPNNPTGVFYLSSGYPAAYADPLTGSLFVLDGANIKKWDAGAALMSAKFRSKAYRMPSCNMGYGRVIADAYPVTLRLVADGAITATVTVGDDGVFSLPGGYEAQVWQLEGETSGGAITSMHVAETPEELLE